MYNQTKQSAGLSTFSFPTIFYGRAAYVAVVWTRKYSDVLLDGELVARLRFAEDARAWVVAEGELNDYDLVKEIGSRIEAKYY
jgi:hypothetical protein